MKKLHRYVFLVFALVSVAMVAWAIVAGMSAPDSAKIANSTPLVQQFDANLQAESSPSKIIASKGRASTLDTPKYSIAITRLA